MRKTLLFYVSICLIFVGCASKKKALQDQDGALSNGDISSSSMNFDQQGSDSGKIAGLSTVHFAFNDSKLDNEMRKELVEDAKWMKSHKNVKIQVEGNCDQRGSDEYNLALGEKRAKSVARYLETLGVSSKKITTVSYGKERLLATGETEEDYAKNRRVNFVPAPIK